MPPQLNNPLPTAVLDTNVFVSGTTVANGPPAQVIDLWRENLYQLAISEPLLEEIKRVFLYPKIAKLTGMPEDVVDEFIQDVRQSALVVPGTTPINVCKDPDDNLLFSCAVETSANFIVSGDKKHVLSIGVFRGIKTISPKDFVFRLLAESY